MAHRQGRGILPPDTQLHSIMDNDNDKGRFRLIEMILVNPYNNWSICFAGTVRQVQPKGQDPYYFGSVNIEFDRFCCISKDKDSVSDILKSLFLFKYFGPGYRRNFRTYPTQFGSLNIN